MSQQRETLKRLSSLLAPGEEGYINAIVEFSTEYKADPTILPTEWLDLSAKQTVVHFGGYLVAHKGFNAHQAYGFRDVIATYSDDIDLTAPRQVISDLLNSLEAKLSEINLEASNNDLELGIAGEGATKRLRTALADVKVASAVHLTRKSVTELMAVREEIDALLSKVAVESTPVKNGVKVAS
jgi:hypothetical protein